MEYGAGASYGRRGVRGRLSPDGRRLEIWSEWYEGNVSPEPVGYALERDGAVFTGSWRTRSLSGTILLSVVPA
jgi:hypothetical protein